MDAAIDAILEIFAWVGLGAGLLLAIVALILVIVDGTWLPVRAVVEETDEGPVVRWFGEERVHEASLTQQQAVALAGKKEADVFARRGGSPRVRLTRGAPVVRSVILLAAGLIAVGVVALVTSWILLFARG